MINANPTPFKMTMTKTPETTSSAPIDASQIDLTDVPFRPFPDVAQKGAGGFQVVFKRSVLNEIARHGMASPGVEVCGVIVGNLYRDDSGLFLYVDASVRGNGAESAGASVTFKADTWTHIQNVMDREHPTRRIVGWYHTHPSFGIFLSDMDVFIQKNFFNLPWQIAYVFDPVSGEQGVFVWRGDVPVPERLLVEEDEKPVPMPGQNQPGGAVSNEVLDRLSRVESKQRTLGVLLAVLCVVSFAWPVAYSRLKQVNSASDDDAIRSIDRMLLPSMEGVTLPTTLPAR